MMLLLIYFILISSLIYFIIMKLLLYIYILLLILCGLILIISIVYMLSFFFGILKNITTYLVLKFKIKTSNFNLKNLNIIIVSGTIVCMIGFIIRQSICLFLDIDLISLRLNPLIGIPVIMLMMYISQCVKSFIQKLYDKYLPSEADKIITFIIIFLLLHIIIIFLGIIIMIYKFLL